MTSLTRRRGEAEESEEGYFASVSDLMVGILFVFLLMLTVFALNFRDAESEQMVERARLLAAQAQAEQNRLEAEHQQAEARREKDANDHLRALLGKAVGQVERELDERIAARRNLLLLLKRNLWEKGQIDLSVDERSGILHLSGDLLFRNNSAALGAEAQQTVQAVSDALAAIVPCYASATAPAARPEGRTPILEAVLIEGHTDRQPIKGSGGFAPTTSSPPNGRSPCSRSFGDARPGSRRCATRTDNHCSALPATASVGRWRTLRATLTPNMPATAVSTCASSCRRAPRPSSRSCARRSTKRWKAAREPHRCELVSLRAHLQASACSHAGLAFRARARALRAGRGTARDGGRARAARRRAPGAASAARGRVSGWGRH